jgi:ribosomal protein S18 acetylase RimI-like enzyme
MCPSNQTFEMTFIRRYEPADRDACLRIWRAASEVGHPFLTAADLDRQAVAVRDIYLPQAETWVFVEAGGRVAGFIGLLGDLVGGLFVDPACHRAGVGRALVKHAARRKGALSVEVYEANVSARSFYRKVGFVETGRREFDDEGRPLPLIRMMRPEHAEGAGSD